MAGRRRPRVAADGARRPLAALHAARAAGTRRSGARARWTNFRNENYERTLSPALVAGYERAGYCWVVTRLDAERAAPQIEPDAVPQAIAYYRTLARASHVVAARFSPYQRGARPVAFNFDWSFDSYPLAYERSGPVVTIWHMRMEADCTSVD